MGLTIFGVLAGSPRAEAASRVVSFSPVATAILLELGYRDRLVGADAVSAALPGAAGVPVAEVGSPRAFSPDLVLAPPRLLPILRYTIPEAEVVAVEPHDFAEGWELYRTLGGRLGGYDDARRHVLEMTRPLAEISAASFGKRRPRVVAVLALDPLEIAGGHSFVTDLIELGGGESITHGTEASRLRWGAEEIARARPELVLVIGAGAADDAAMAGIRSLVGAGARIERLEIEPERFWLRDALPALERVHGWIEAVR